MHRCIKHDNLYMQAEQLMNRQYLGWVRAGCPEGALEVEGGDPFYKVPSRAEKLKWFNAGLAAGAYTPAQKDTFVRSVDRFREEMIRNQNAAQRRPKAKAKAKAMGVRLRAKAKAKAQAKAEA